MLLRCGVAVATVSDPAPPFEHPIVFGGLMFFFIYSSIPAGHSEDDLRVSGPGRNLEHGTAAPCRPRAVLLHPVSQRGNGLHARGRAQRLVREQVTAP